jgi:hypothetical protein
MNIDRVPDLGTVEVRCFPLEMQGEIVSRWVSWLLALKDMAISEPDKTYRALWKNIRQNPEWYAGRIFGTELDKISPTHFRDLVELGTQTGYELTRVLKSWYSGTMQSSGLRKKRYA